MKKMFCFDVETTGLDPVRNKVVQLSGIIDIDGEVVEELNYFMRPHGENMDDIEVKKALEIQGRTVREVLSYSSPILAYQNLLNVFDKYVDKYNKNDKFTVVGYNVSFDVSFLNEFFKSMGNNFLFSYLGVQIDPLPIVRFLSESGKLYKKLDNFKLETVCNFFGVNIDAHDAMSDINATKEILDVLCKDISIGNFDAIEDKSGSEEYLYNL